MQKQQDILRIVIAGGGTGGHLFPGIAVARELEKRVSHPKILFVVGRKKMETEILSRYGYAVRSISIEGIKGREWKKGMAMFINMPKSLVQSFAILRSFSPDIVLGVGAYSSGPFCLAAKLNKTPTAIHEQNSYPGITNRVLSRWVDRVFVSFEESSQYLKSNTCICTGNPVREELFDVTGDAKTKGLRVLVVGGSQGAEAVNKAFAAALAYLKKEKRHLTVIHQTGKTDYERTAADYKAKGLTGEISPFIDDMARAYGRADLVISRAGATTIAELAVLGKPAILVPYPYATNRHQEINAQSLIRAGGAEMILQKNLSGKGLACTIIKYMENRKLLNNMGRAARSRGKKDAAKVIVDHLLDMVNPAY